MQRIAWHIVGIASKTLPHAHDMFSFYSCNEKPEKAIETYTKTNNIARWQKLLYRV